MGPGGVTEIIAHFAGYLWMPEDFARFRLDYNGGIAPHDKPWTPDPVREPTHAAPLDELPSQPFRLALPPAPFALINVHLHPLHPLHAAPHGPPPMHILPTLVQAPPVDASFFGVGEDMASPDVRPDQELIVVNQVNVLHNDGVVLMAQGTDVTLLHGTHAAADFAALIQEAQAPVPAWMPNLNSSQAAIDAVNAHDAGLANGSLAASATLHAGITADGVMQPAGTVFDPPFPTTPAVDGDSSHNGMLTPALVAETGNNISANVASIIDDHTQHTGLVVFGDAYTTNAIVQVNVLSSTANIEVGGPSAALDIVTDGNTAGNVASFAVHATNVGTVDHFSPTAQIDVDRINGNFYDVKSFEQLNYVSNNDTVVQGTMSTYYEVDSGNDTQINDLPLSELAQNYDLIIVHGSFHSSNFILQQNVLMNDDIVKMFTARGDTATQSITTGDNTLQNSASIDLYGNQTYQPLSADTLAAIGQLEQGKLDPTLAASLHGGGTLHVLDITGDFYDINSITQTNLVSNVDTAVQYLPNTGTSTSPTGVATTSTETIVSGHNQLANLAGIAVVGTTSDFQFVGGQHYDDAILVQANLVTDSKVVTIGDTHTLASEVVAFTGLHDVLAPQHEPAAAPTLDTAQHQDLFHGMMA